jgi:hypothetical protein
MIKSVNNYPVSQLFNIESSAVIYAIPRYQREYTWGKTHWENLFDDVHENKQGYFLGSIICINQSNDALSVQKLELVDGQQRLTTLSLLFAAIYDTLKKREKELNKEQELDLLNLKRKLILKNDEAQIRLIPQTQNNNNADYCAVLSEAGIISEYSAPAYAGNRKIFRAYRYFQDRIAQIANAQEGGVKAIVEFLDKVNQACLVKIEVFSHADAYTLFESLNNRGMPLTAIDLIKNKLLAKLENIEPGRVDSYFEHWVKILAYLGDDYAVQERFVRQYYNAFQDDLKSIRNVSMATRSNVIQIYEELINSDAKDCLQKISLAAKQYSFILSRSKDNTLTLLEKPFKDLERIQGAPSHLFMLYLLVKRKELELSSKHLTAVVNLLVRFFVRRNLTDTPPTRDLDRLFMGLCKKVNELDGESIPRLIEQQLISVSAPDAIFQQKLEGAIYEENSWVTRFILCALAERGMTKETRENLWLVENKQFIWTIEHIFPQGENIPQEWVDMIADGDGEKAKEIQQIYVHKLGNLTMTGFNSALSNKSFQAKRDHSDKSGRADGYKNGLKLNEDLANATSWSIDQIKVRTKKLVKQTMKMFSLSDNGL